MGSRQQHHENLWRCFNAQTWPDKELVVLETYEDAPSSFLASKALTDKRLVHVAIPRKAGTVDFTVGLKRNMTLHLASGEFVVNFDDDDLYAPAYVQKIVGAMQARGLIGVTLSAWYNYYVGKGVCTFSDPSGWGEWVSDAAELDNILYGYGFSYSHKRQPSLQNPYPNVGFAEDAPFFLKLRDLFGKQRVVLWKDLEGLCVHIMHRANTAQVLGSSDVSPQDIAKLAVTDLKPFQSMIDNDFFTFSPWRPPVRPPAVSICSDPSVPGGSAAFFVNDVVWDAKSRLRTATFDAGSVSIPVEPPATPDKDTFRNSESATPSPLKHLTSWAVEGGGRVGVRVYNPKC
jgi:hypothetical protein